MPGLDLLSADGFNELAAEALPARLGVKVCVRPDGFLSTHSFQTGSSSSFCCCADSLGASLLSLVVIFDVILFHPSFLLLFYFCLSPGWLQWVSCRLWQQSGSQAVTQQLRAAAVLLKSLSINIIIACSRHHWIFYCNVQQNVPPTQRKC